MSRALRFSVGIPTRNQANYLPMTLDSLLAQTRLPDEIVISDHESTDATPEIIADYAARHPGLIRGVKPPLGCNVGGQWIYTIANLSGDWITLFSSDDIAYPQFCETLLRGATREPDAVLVRAGWENIDAQGKELSKELLLSVRDVTKAPQNLLEQKRGPKASFAAFAVQREALEVSGGYPAGMESFGDWPMFAQLAPFGSFIRENAIISGYRISMEDKFRARLGMWLRDEQRMFGEVFPLAAERMQMTDRAWIAEASKQNFFRYLYAAVADLNVEERQAHVADFRSWAASVGETKVVERFAAGDSIRPPFQLKDKLHNWARGPVHRVLGWKRKLTKRAS